MYKDPNVNYMDNPSKFLIDNGLLFQINRDVLHPLGLALQLDPETNELELWDYQDDPEGMCFSEEAFNQGIIKMARYMINLGLDRHETREQSLGYVIQGEPGKNVPGFERMRMLALASQTLPEDD